MHAMTGEFHYCGLHYVCRVSVHVLCSLYSQHALSLCAVCAPWGAAAPPRAGSGAHTRAPPRTRASSTRRPVRAVAVRRGADPARAPPRGGPVREHPAARTARTSPHTRRARALQP